MEFNFKPEFNSETFVQNIFANIDNLTTPTNEGHEPTFAKERRDLVVATVINNIDTVMKVHTPTKITARLLFNSTLGRFRTLVEAKKIDKKIAPAACLTFSINNYNVTVIKCDPVIKICDQLHLDTFEAGPVIDFLASKEPYLFDESDGYLEYVAIASLQIYGELGAPRKRTAIGCLFASTIIGSTIYQDVDMKPLALVNNIKNAEEAVLGLSSYTHPYYRHMGINTSLKEHLYNYLHKNVYKAGDVPIYSVVHVDNVASAKSMLKKFSIKALLISFYSKHGRDCLFSQIIVGNDGTTSMTISGRADKYGFEYCWE